MNASAVDAFGQMYVAGGTSDSHYPVTDGTSWQNCESGLSGFAFPRQNSVVIKINSVGVSCCSPPMRVLARAAQNWHRGRFDRSAM